MATKKKVTKKVTKEAPKKETKPAPFTVYNPAGEFLKELYKEG